MCNRIIVIILFIIFSVPPDIFADAVYLKNGRKLSGIIIKEDENSVQIKINIGASVTFSKEDVEKIERDSGEKHAEMEKAWEADWSKKEAAGIKEGASREEGSTEDLVQYKGEWITPEEKERLQAMGIAGDTDKAHRERRFSLKKDKARRSAVAAQLLDKGNWFVKETEHFSIFYRDASQAKIISDKAEYYFEKITYDLGYENEINWNSKCQVYIVESTEKWKVFLKGLGFNAELVGGFVPNYGEKEMFLCALSEGYLAITFPHELTHLIFNEIAGKSSIPLWLNEGLANYEASVTSVSNSLLVKYIKQGRHILLGDLLRMTSYPEGKETRELFYAQSEKLTEFLITQYGRKKFRKFCDLVLNDKSFKDALFTAYKDDFKDIADFNVKMVEYIVK